MDIPEGYELLKEGEIEFGDKVLGNTGWQEPYVMWIGQPVGKFKGVARRVRRGT